MATTTIPIKDAAGNDIFIRGTGAKTDLDPFIPTHNKQLHCKDISNEK